MTRRGSAETAFDTAVRGYSEWVDSLPHQQRPSGLGAFLRGWASAFAVTGTPVRHRHHGNPLYSREDLTPAQMDAIALASDWERVGRSLGSGLNDRSGVRGIPLPQEMYEHLRDVYEANRTK